MAAKDVVVLAGSPEMARAREALKTVTAAREASIAADPDIPEAEDRALRRAIARAEFGCELALMSLTGLINHMAGDGS